MRVKSPQTQPDFYLAAKFNLDFTAWNHFIGCDIIAQWQPRVILRNYSWKATDPPLLLLLVLLLRFQPPAQCRFKVRRLCCWALP